VIEKSRIFLGIEKIATVWFFGLTGNLREVSRSHLITMMKPSATWRSATSGPMALRPTLASSLPLSDFNERAGDTYKNVNYMLCILKDDTKDYHENTHTPCVKIFSLLSRHGFFSA
jgi:hypothetical protein